jgi:sulfonate transport system permease protein
MNPSGKRQVRIAVIFALVLAWQIAAWLSPKTPLAQMPLVPSWEFIFGPSLLGMADYWRFPFWAPNTSIGGEKTLHGALLALAWHSLLTWGRLLAGLAIGAAVGIGAGLALSWSPVLRRMAYLPLNALRMVPLLAMIPLFQFWVGTSTAGAIAFVAYGAAVVYLVGTLNAIANVPNRYVDYARTLGAPSWRVWTAIILPAIVPELCSSVLLTLGLGWSAVIAAEYVGIENGLGRIMIFAQFMSQTGRMALVTVLLVLYASLSYAVFHRLVERALAWMPGRHA